MKFVSYAQNFEDVILWRALNAFGPGFYIDVGACDPLYDSVTKSFYDRGWYGINIEPIKSAYELVKSQRSRDINLNIAIDSYNGNASLYSVDGGNGLSTTIDEIAEKYRREGKDVLSVQINVRTLADICEEFVSHDIHFLKIDVEGNERNVLLGADFKKYRPWILVIESTLPNTNIPNHSSWESIVIDSGYKFVYFDGLNRYYVSNEKLPLLESYFSVPPNWFDNFEKWDKMKLDEENKKLNSVLYKKDQEIDSCYQELFESSRCIGSLQKERNNAYIRIHQLDREIERLNEIIKNNNNEITRLNESNAMLNGNVAAFINSSSWKVTWFFRIIKKWIYK
ncbi:FkbM family methyltransferase [Dickeya undicola]|uniref:FkbM family methyltransferase n=1 Tax=Dickeya undicola TaxID=1577887 RepID=UPI00067AD56E|nr:FkbM family methyltransferase [Dickeya undicola]